MEKSTYEVIATEIMAKGWSQLVRMTVLAKLRNGTKVELLREVADHGHGASILPVDWARGTVLLVRQWRAGAAFTGHHGWLIETCAGLLDADDPVGCATREAFEELGVIVRNVTHINDCFCSPGAFSEKISLFIADYSPEDRVAAGGGLASEHEDIEVIEVPLVNAYEMVATGDIVDAKTIILLQHAMLAARSQKTD
jgi:GDP-mannose pyrophosphatase NudK